MGFALDLGISPRHMSFVETGRSRPSRDLLSRMAGVLAIPLREENVLLEAAGYSRRYSESGLDEPELDHIRSVLRFLLDRHEPHSALVFDRKWDIVMSNDAHKRALSFFAPAGSAENVGHNLLRLVFHPDGLRKCIVNFDVVGATLLARAETELNEAPSSQGLRELIAEVRGYGPIPPSIPRAGIPPDLLLPVHLRRDAVDVRLFSVLGSIGAPTQVTLQELRIETFFPVDQASAEALSALNALSGPPRGAVT